MARSHLIFATTGRSMPLTDGMGRFREWLQAMTVLENIVHGFKSLVAMAVGVAAIVAVWTMLGLPGLAWSTDLEKIDAKFETAIDSLNSGQLLLTIEFTQEKRNNLYQRKAYTGGQIYWLNQEPKSEAKRRYFENLKTEMDWVEQEIGRTDIRLEKLEEAAIKKIGE